MSSKLAGLLGNDGLLELEALLRRALGSSGPYTPPHTPPTPPGRTGKTGSDPQRFVDDYKDGVKTVLRSMMDAANADKTYAEKMHNLARSTETIGNKYLDSVVKTVMSSSASLSSANADLTAHMQEFSNMNAKDFIDELNKMRAAVTDAESALAKAAKDNFTDAAAAHTNYFAFATDDAYETIKDSAQKFGSSLSSSAKDTAERMSNGWPVVREKLKELAAELDNASAKTKKYTDDQLEVARKEIARGIARQKRDEALMNVLGVKTLEFTGFLGLLGVALKQAFTDYRMVASAGLAGRFGEISMAGLRLGVSVEKLTAIYRENARGLAMGMGGSFLKTLSDGQNGLMLLGLKAEEAAAGANGFYKNAIASGLNPRQTDKLNASIKFQTDAFADLRSITGATIEEFNSMNEAMATNVENLTMSLRYAPQEREARFQELVSLRNEFTQRGLSAKAADAMVQAMQGFSKNKLKDRYEAAARIQQAAGLMGMGGEGATAANLMRKRKRTGAEDAQLAGITSNIKGAMEQFGNMGPAAENLTDVLDEGMGAAAKGLLDAGVGLKAAADAQMGVTKAQVAKEKDTNTVSAGEARVMMTIDQAANMLNSSLGKILIAVVGIAASMIRGNAKGALDVLENLIPSKILRPLKAIGGFLKSWFVPLTIIVGAGKGIYDTFTKFSDFMNPDGWISNIGVTLLNMGKGILDVFLWLPGNIVNFLSKTLFDTDLSFISKWWDDLIDGWSFSLLGVSEADKKRAKAEKEAAKAAKDNTAAIEKKTAAEKTAEERLGVTSGPITVRDLQMQAKQLDTSPIAGGSTDKSVVDKNINISQAPSVPQGASPVSNNATSTSGVASKPITLEDVYKKLHEILEATKEDTEEVTEALGKMKKPKFDNGPQLHYA